MKKVSKIWLVNIIPFSVCWGRQGVISLINRASSQAPMVEGMEATLFCLMKLKGKWACDYVVTHGNHKWESWKSGSLPTWALVLWIALLKCIYLFEREGEKALQSLTARELTTTTTNFCLLVYSPNATARWGGFKQMRRTQDLHEHMLHHRCIHGTLCPNLLLDSMPDSDLE